MGRTSILWGEGFGALALGLLLLGEAGCTGDDKPTGEPMASAYGEPDCHGSSNTCFPVLQVDTDILRHCFLWDGPNQQWPAGTPQAVLDECPNPETMGQYCQFSYDVEYGVECTNGCGSCLVLEADVPAGAPFPIDEIALPDDRCCDCTLALTGLDDFITALADCGFIGQELWNCPDPDWIVLDEEECPGDTTSRAPDADYVLQVDPLASFLLLSVLGENEIVSLSGGGSLTLTTDESLTATLWAEDGILAGQTLEDWVFWGTVPIEYDASSGTFLLPSQDAPILPGRGQVDGVPSRLDVGMTHNATGTVSPSTGSWACDYTESLAGQSVQLHVEGTLEVAP